MEKLKGKLQSFINGRNQTIAEAQAHVDDAMTLLDAIERGEMPSDEQLEYYHNLAAGTDSMVLRKHIVRYIHTVKSMRGQESR